MKRYSNGDVSLTEDEYNALMYGESRTIKDIGDYMIKHSKLFWNLKEEIFKASSLSTFDYNANHIPETIEVRRIDEKDYNLYIKLKQMICDFDPND